MTQLSSDRTAHRGRVFPERRRLMVANASKLGYL